MDKLTNKLVDKARRYLMRKARVNKTVKAVGEFPRLIINRSNKFIYAQIVDVNWKVISASDDVKESKWTKKERAKKVGLDIAKKALKQWVQQVCFDRNWFLYHGRVKELADWAREGWLKL